MAGVLAALTLVGCGGGQHKPSARSAGGHPEQVKRCMFTQAGIKLCGNDAVSYCQRDPSAYADGCTPITAEYIRLSGQETAIEGEANRMADGLEARERRVDEVRRKDEEELAQERAARGE
jgi:hypothetical protein